MPRARPLPNGVVLLAPGHAPGLGPGSAPGLGPCSAPGHAPGPGPCHAPGLGPGSAPGLASSWRYGVSIGGTGEGPGDASGSRFDTLRPTPSISQKLYSRKLNVLFRSQKLNVSFLSTNLMLRVLVAVTECSQLLFSIVPVERYLLSVTLLL